MMIWGVDNSINGTGVCIMNMDDESNKVLDIKLHGFSKKMHYEDGTEVVFDDENVIISRLPQKYSSLPYHRKPTYISNILFEKYGMPDYAFFEDYAISNGKQSNNLTIVAEFCGGLKECFYAANIPYMVYVPGQIKLFATNNGNADKVMMGDAFSASFEEKMVKSSKYFKLKKYESPRGDLVDAFWMAALGRYQLLVKFNEQEALAALPSKKAEMFRPKKMKTKGQALADRPFVRKEDS
jgi:Holliday junction resolvasome RuvABC endonuclease subunit